MPPPIKQNLSPHPLYDCCAPVGCETLSLFIKKNKSVRQNPHWAINSNSSPVQLEFFRYQFWKCSRHWKKCWHLHQRVLESMHWSDTMYFITNRTHFALLALHFGNQIFSCPKSQHRKLSGAALTTTILHQRKRNNLDELDRVDNKSAIWQYFTKDNPTSETATCNLEGWHKCCYLSFQCQQP